MNKVGQVAVVGIGPGNPNMMTEEVKLAIDQASDIVGYQTYVDRIAPRPGLTLHPSNNRVELERARSAFELAADGRKVVIVSSGDPGVFAMAAAVFEALESGDPAWQEIDVQILPGITSMLAAAARLGAPLGHDFCAINLSDNLKSRDLILNRVRMAARGDFVMSFYNPRSKSRPDFFAEILDILGEECGAERLIMFARAVSTDEEELTVTTLGDATGEMADMRTMVIVGSSMTRRVKGTRYVYSPRGAE